MKIASIMDIDHFRRTKIITLRYRTETVCPGCGKYQDQNQRVALRFAGVCFECLERRENHGVF